MREWWIVFQDDDEDDVYFISRKPIGGKHPEVHVIEASALTALKETVISLWEEHQKTKFLSDGSHFQADIKLNEFIAGLRKP